MGSNDKILRLPQVITQTGLKRSTIYALIEVKEFPRQFKLGARSVGWFESDIIRWLKSRKTVRQQNASK